LGAELGEERIERGGVLALAGPHDIAAGVVHDHGQVVVVLLPDMRVIPAHSGT
jgi:hypothetical protein